MARGKGEGSISKLPNGSWCARVTTGYDANGKQQRKAYYGKTRKEVLQKLTATQNEVNKGVYVEPSTLTLADWCNTWLEEYKKRTVKPSYYGALHYRLNHYTIPFIGKIKLKDLRAEHVQKFVNQLSDTGLTATTVQSVHRALHGALEQAVTNELIAKNVSAKVKYPKESKPEMSVLSQDEQARFIEVAKKTVTGRAYILALCTGLRLGEMLALTWDDVNFESGMLSVNKAHTKCLAPKQDGTGYKTQYTVGTPKTKSSVRMIPLLPDILEMLKTEKENALPSEYNLIFPDIKGGYILHNTARLRFVAILKEAGIPEDKQLHPHSLRHSFATRGLENGIPLKVMQELLGHANIGMTADLYTHVLPETKQAEMMKLADTVKLEPPIGAEQQDTSTQQ